MSTLYDGPLAFVDVETTGGNPERSRIIEVGIVAAAGGELEYEWSTLVNPGVSVPAEIQHFTGISAEMVREAPFFEDIAREVSAHLEGRLFVAHNARFDHGFLRRELARAGLKLANRTACTVKLSRRLHPEERTHSLDALIERHRLPTDIRHRALPDARALWQLWNVLAAVHPLERIEQVLQEMVNFTSLPPHLPRELPDELPECPGVYRFYGEDDALLYVGKANNIRTRVLSHWQGTGRDSKSQRLAALTRRIDWTATAGELGALLLEAKLVRKDKPLYNRRLRSASEVWTWVVADDGATPELAPIDEVPLSFEHSDCFGAFRSAASARKALTGIARSERLCLKVLGLESAAGSCFARQLGRCAGACVGEEPLARHAARVKLALLPHRLKPWPFRGAVGVREAHTSGATQLHILDEWRHIATLEEGDELPARYRVAFDLDIYQILQRHLRRAARVELLELPWSRTA